MTQSAPLTPPDCDLQDFPFMPLMISRLRKSKAWVKARRNPALGFYMVNLWMAAWHEVPAGSLEDDDDVLADAAMCDASKWDKVRAEVLRGWVKCNDGRWYHPVVCERVLEAWQAKSERLDRNEHDRDRKRLEREERSKHFATLKAAGIHKRWDTSLTELREAVRNLSAGQVKEDSGTVRHLSRLREGEGEGEVNTNTPARAKSTSTVDGPEGGPFAHTLAGDVGRAFQRAGVDPDQVNLADVRLAALLAQGVTPEEFEGLAREAVRKSIEHPFGWVLKVLPERRAEAAGIKAAPPAPEVPWFDTAKGVRETGLRLGCGDWSDEIYAATGEQYPTYKRRVLAAARRAGLPMPEDIPA